MRTIEDPPRIAEEKLENAVFRQRQPEFLVLQRHAMRHIVKDKSVERHPVGSAGRVLAQRGADPREQHLLRKRLGHIVVRPGIESGDDVTLRAPGRQHDDGDGGRLRIRPQLAADVKAVKAGKHQVQEDEIRPLLESNLHGHIARFDLLDVRVSPALERKRNHPTNRRVVLHNKYLLSAHGGNYSK